MRRGAAALILVAAGAFAAEPDPPGTVSVTLEVGKTKPVEAVPGSNVLCDDLAVVAPEFADDGFILRALKPGSTLCGVWLAGAKPGGLYRVTVVPAKKP